MGAKAANDFKLQRGNKVESVTLRIQNCRCAKKAGIPLPKDMAKEERKSPITNEYATATPKQKEKVDAEMIQEESFPLVRSHISPIFLAWVSCVNLPYIWKE